MSTSALTIAGAVKDAWTDTELQKQFEDKNSPLSALESVRGTMIGTQAQVPILAGRAGSYTSVGAAGGALNPATGQPREGLLDIQTAHEQFKTWEETRMRSWAKTKRAPYVSPGGLPATEVPDPGHGQQARLNRAMLSLRNNMGDNE